MAKTTVGPWPPTDEPRVDVSKQLRLTLDVLEGQFPRIEGLRSPGVHVRRFDTVQLRNFVGALTKVLGSVARSAHGEGAKEALHGEVAESLDLLRDADPLVGRTEALVQAVLRKLQNGEFKELPELVGECTLHVTTALGYLVALRSCYRRAFRAEQAGMSVQELEDVAKQAGG
jgi:hypothetical protein